MKPSEDRFEALVARQANIIAKVCYMYASDSQHFDDLRQECLINIWRGLDRFRGDSRESTWVYRACINTCITFYRRNRRHVEGAVPLEAVFDIAADDDGKLERIAMLYRLISGLSDVDKAVIMMWLDEMSYDEIADATGITRNTIASRLRRIKVKLAEKAKEE